MVVSCGAETSVPGLFAAGDVTNLPAEQVLIAIGEGAKATLNAYEYLLRRKTDGRLDRETWKGRHMTAKLIDGKTIAANVRQEVAEEVAALKAQTGKVPTLAVVLVGENPASQTYVRSKGKACARPAWARSRNPAGHGQPGRGRGPGRGA